jgi:hypothetical protein
MAIENVEPRRASWRMLTVGSSVWAPCGERGWHPGTITGLGKKRGDNKAVHLRFESGGKDQRYAKEVFWRKPELKDKPKAQTVSA